MGGFLLEAVRLLKRKKSKALGNSLLPKMEWGVSDEVEMGRLFIVTDTL
jgi:hypothetical protein